MKNIHEPATLNELISRFNQLTPATQRQWGKMDVAQMMAHCSNALESSLGDQVSKQALIGKIFGRIAKKSIVSDKPIKQNLPTAPSFLVTAPAEFEKEKQRLTALITRLSKSDPNAIAQNIHPFFGKLTPEEWGILNYKHMDHHLRQFGV